MPSLKQLLSKKSPKEEKTQQSPYDECLEILKTGNLDHIKKLHETEEFRQKLYGSEKEVSPNFVDMPTKLKIDGEVEEMRYFIRPVAEFLIFASKQKQSLSKYAKTIRWLLLQSGNVIAWSANSKESYRGCNFTLKAMVDQLSPGIAKCVSNALKEQERLKRLEYIKDHLRHCLSERERSNLGLDNPKQKFSLKVLRNASPKALEKLLECIQFDENCIIDDHQGSAYDRDLVPYETMKKEILRSTKKTLSPNVLKNIVDLRMSKE